MGGLGDFFSSDVFGFIAGSLAIVGGILTGQLWLVGLGLATISAVLAGRPDHESIFQNRGSTQASLPVVYGTTKIGAKLVDTRDDPNNETTLHRVLAFCVGSENGHGIEGVGEVFFDEERAITNAVPGNDSLTVDNIDDFWVDGGPKFGYSLQLGEDDQVVDVNLNAIWPTAWPTTSKGNGIVWMDFALIRDEDPSKENKYRGIPNVTAEIQGNRVYDPRDPTGGPDGDGYIFSHNPALCILDYLTSKRYGAGRPYGERDVARVGTPQVSTAFSHPEGDTTVNIEAEAGESLAIQIGTRITFEDHPHIYTTQTVIELSAGETKAVVLDRGLEAALSGGEAVLPADPSVIDEQSFIAAANYCDEQITVPRTGGQETQARFTADVWLDTGDAIARNIAVLESACRGNLVYERGQYRLVIRKAQAPVDFTLTEDNIIGDWSFSRSGAEDTPNQITVRHPDKDRRFTTQEITWPARETNPYIEEDGGWENNRDLKLPATTDRLRAEQIGMTMLKEARADKAATLRATEAAMVLSVGDVVPVTHDLPGWNQKEFFVTTMGLRPDATVELALREYDPDAYVIGEQGVPDDVPEPDLPPIPCPDTLPDFGDLIVLADQIGGVVCDTDNLSVTNPHTRNFTGVAPDVADECLGISKGDGTPDYGLTDGRCSGSTIKTGATTQDLISSNMLVFPSSVQLDNTGDGFTLMGSFQIVDSSLQNDQTLFGQIDQTNNEGFRIVVDAFSGLNRIKLGYYRASDGALQNISVTLPDDIPTCTKESTGDDSCPGGSFDIAGDWADFAFVFTGTEVGGVTGGSSSETFFFVFLNGRLQTGTAIDVIEKPVSGATLAAGGARGDDNSQHDFNGSFDRISAWKRGLSLCEVQNLDANLCTFERLLDDRDAIRLEPTLNISVDRDNPISVTITPAYNDLTIGDKTLGIIEFFEDGELIAQTSTTNLLDTSCNVSTFTLSATEGGESEAQHTIRMELTIVDRSSGEQLASESVGALYTYQAGQTAATASISVG